MVVNKMESTMFGTKKSPTKLKVKHTIETTKSTEQETLRRRPSMKEWHEKAYTFHLDDLESLFKQTIKSQDTILPESKRPIKADTVNDPKYYKYHPIFGPYIAKLFCV